MINGFHEFNENLQFAFESVDYQHLLSHLRHLVIFSIKLHLELESMDLFQKKYLIVLVIFSTSRLIK